MAYFPQIGIGAPFFRAFGGTDTQAQAHYDRVIADGGIMPAGLLGCNAWFVAVKAVYATTDVTTAISAGYDPHYLGAKIGAGSGTTLGQAATKLYSCSGASGDLVQTAAASMPLLLVKNSTDANYWFGSGVTGNYCSTPNAAANQITGDIEFIFYVKDYMNNGASLYTLASKDSGTRAYTFYINSNNRLNLSINGNDQDSSVSISSTYTGWVRANFISSTGVIKFYTSSDLESTSPLSVSWTQLGTNIAGSAGAINNISATLNIGGYNTTGLFAMHGKIVRATISNSIGGTPVVDFNPASYNAATSQSSWVSATSETWTINKSSGNTFVGVLVDRTIIQGNNTTTSMSVTIAGIQPYTEYLTATRNGIGSYISRATGNQREHTGTNLTLSNGANLLKADTSVIRQTMTYRSNNTNSGIAVNNGTETTGAAGANNGTTLVVAEGAHNTTTLISSLAEDSAPQRAAMYAAVKSFNNY